MSAGCESAFASAVILIGFGVLILLNILSLWDIAPGKKKEGRRGD